MILDLDAIIQLQPIRTKILWHFSNCSKMPALMNYFNSCFLIQAHLRTHSGESPFSCNICQRNFRQKSGLNSHMKQIHDNIKPFMCPHSECHHKFKRKAHLDSHIASYHGAPRYSTWVVSLKGEDKLTFIQYDSWVEYNKKRITLRTASLWN